MSKLAKELEEQDKRNLLIIISGPSCSGKDSVIAELLKRNKNMTRLVTTNSRPKRPGEKEGWDYYFVNREQFEKLIAENAFYEWVEYRGSYRGGQKKHVKQALKSGKDVLWRIDVRGVKNIQKRVRKEIPNCIFIFLTETLDVLKKRMKKRATETKQEFKWSIDRAKWELNQYQSFDYLVRNVQGKLKETVEKVEDIIEAEKRRVKE